MLQRKTLVRTVDALGAAASPSVGVTELVEAGWLAHGEHPRTNDPCLLFGPDCGAVVGLSAERESLWWATCGPTGPLQWDRLEAGIAPIADAPASPDEVRAMLTRGLRAARETLDGDAIAAIGIAWPSAIGFDGEPVAYEVHHPDFADNGDGAPLPLKALVREAAAEAGLVAAPRAHGRPLPIHVVNDADADLVYEARHGCARDLSSVMLVKVCGGLGLSVLDQGRIVRGHAGRAGEIQHIEVRYEHARLEGGKRGDIRELSDLERCWCEGHSCIARFATGRAIIDQLVSYSRGSYNERGAAIERDANEPAVRDVCGRAGSLLGQALIGPTLAINPQRVVVRAFPRSEHLLQGLRTALTQGTTVNLGLSDIELSEAGGEATAVGAAQLAIEDSVILDLEDNFMPPSKARVRDLPFRLRARVGAEADLDPAHLARAVRGYADPH